MSTEKSINILTDFPKNQCNVCNQSFRLKIELVHHKRRDHSGLDKDPSVNFKSNQNLTENFQLSTLQHKQNSEEKMSKVKKSGTAFTHHEEDYNNQQEEVDEDKEMEADEKEQYYRDFILGTDFFQDDSDIETELEIFFQCSNCGSNFLTLDNLNTHEPKCDDEILNRQRIFAEKATSNSSLFEVQEEDTKLQAFHFLKNQLNKKRKGEHQDPILDDDKNDEEKERIKTKKRRRKDENKQVVEAKSQMQEENVQLQLNYSRPRLTYSCLIALAVKNSPTQTATPKQLGKFMIKVFPYFQNAANHNWTNSMLQTLYKNTLFKKITIMKNGQLKPKFVYGFSPEPKSQLRIEKLIEDQCLDFESLIKSSMRHPEKFSSMVSGDLCKPAKDEEKGGGEDKDEEDNDNEREDEEEEKKSSNERPPASFKDIDSSMDLSDTDKLQSLIQLEIEPKTLISEPYRPPLGLRPRPAILRKSTKVNLSTSDHVKSFLIPFVDM